MCDIFFNIKIFDVIKKQFIIVVYYNLNNKMMILEYAKLKFNTLRFLIYVDNDAIYL